MPEKDLKENASLTLLDTLIMWPSLANLAMRIFVGIFSSPWGWGGLAHAQYSNSAAGCWRHCPGVHRAVHAAQRRGGGRSLRFTPRPPTECTTSTKLGQKPASLPNRRFACFLHPCPHQQRPLDESARAGAAILTVGKRRGTLFWATPIFLAMTTCESQANVSCHLPSVSSVC